MNYKVNGIQIWVYRYKAGWLSFCFFIIHVLVMKYKCQSREKRLHLSVHNTYKAGNVKNENRYVDLLNTSQVS